MMPVRTKVMWPPVVPVWPPWSMWVAPTVPTARASLLPPTDSLRSLSSCPAWPAPPNADDEASADASADASPDQSDVVRKVQVLGISHSLLPPTDSLRPLSSCPAWPTPPSADDDANADQSDVVPSGASGAPMVHVGVVPTVPTARASL